MCVHLLINSVYLLLLTLLKCLLLLHHLILSFLSLLVVPQLSLALSCHALGTWACILEGCTGSCMCCTCSS